MDAAGALAAPAAADGQTAAVAGAAAGANNKDAPTASTPPAGGSGGTQPHQQPQHAQPGSDVDSPSELVMALDTPAAPRMRQHQGTPQHHPAPSAGADDDADGGEMLLVQYPSNPSSAPAPAHHGATSLGSHSSMRPRVNGLPLSCAAAGDGSASAPAAPWHQPLPRPAFDILRQPAASADEAPTAPSASGEQRDRREQEAALQHLEQQHYGGGSHTQQQQSQPHGSGDVDMQDAPALPAPASSSVPQRANAGGPAAAAAAPAAAESRDELMQLLSDLPPHEVMAVLRQLKATGNSPDAIGATEGNNQGALLQPPHQQQQQQQGLSAAGAGAGEAGGYPNQQQQPASRPPAAAAAYGGAAAGSGSRPAWGLNLDDSSMQQGVPAMPPQQARGPPQQQQQQRPQATATAAGAAGSQPAATQEAAFAQQLQQLLQQHTQQQQPERPPVGLLPLQQQQQHAGGYRAARPPQVEVPPAPQQQQPVMQASAEDLLQVVQCLVGSGSAAPAAQGLAPPTHSMQGAGHVGLSGPPPAPPPQPALPMAYQQQPQHAPAVVPQAPPPAAAAGSAAGVAEDVVAMIQKLMADKLGHTAPPAAPPAAAPAAAPAPPQPPPAAPGQPLAPGPHCYQQQPVAPPMQQQQQPAAYPSQQPAAAAAAAGLPANLQDVLGAIAATISGVGGGGSGSGSGGAGSSPHADLHQAAQQLLAALTGTNLLPQQQQWQLGPEGAWDPVVAAAAAPRDFPAAAGLPARHQRGSSVQPGRGGDWQGPAGGYAEADDRGWGGGGSYRAGGGGQGARPASRPGNQPPESGGHNNLFALLAALEHEQEHGGGYDEEAGDSYDVTGGQHGDDYHNHHRHHHGYYDAWDEDEEGGYYYDEEVDDEVGGLRRSSSNALGHKQQRGLGRGLPTKKGRKRGAGAPAGPPVADALTEQRWLLQDRPEGKRAVKPNEAFASYTAPVIAHERAAAAGYHAHHGGNHGGRRLPPRQASAVQGHGQGQGQGQGFNPLDAAAMAALPVDFIDGPHRPRRKLRTPRTSYGWYLLGEGRLQGQEGQAAEAGAGAAATRQLLLLAAAGEQQQHSGSNEDPAAGRGLRSSAAAGGMLDDSDEQLPGAAGFPRSVRPAASTSTATGRGAGGVGAGDSGVVSKKGKGKGRWGSVNMQQWVSDDGITVWPKDTQITFEQRVYYLAFKWVAESWPQRVGRSTEIVTLPVTFWLDGEPTNLVLSAKIRLYDKAAHFIISPYASLGSQYAGKWLAGYGYDKPHNMVRIYLTTSKPPAAASPGNRFGRKGKPGQPSASTAAAWDDATPSVSFAAAGAASYGDVSQVPLSRAGSGFGRRGGGGGGRGGGRKRKAAAAWANSGGLVGVPADILMEAEHGPIHPAAAVPVATPTAAAALGQLPDGLPAAGDAGLLDAAAAAAAAWGQEQLSPQQDSKRARPSRSAAAGVAAATIAAGGSITSPAAAAAAAAADGEWDPAASDPATQRSIQRSQNCKAAVARRWAKYREDKAREQAAAEAAARAAAVSAMQMPQLGGRELVADISTINTALLFVSDSMSLPGELLEGLCKQLLQALRTAAATDSAAAAAAAAAAHEGSAQAAVVAARGAVGAQLHAAVQDWYVRLCAAVAARNGSMVAELIEELGTKVLAVAA